MRKSSRGNPYHYPKGHPKAGRFAPAGVNGVVVVRNSPEYYEKRTAERTGEPENAKMPWETGRFSGNPNAKLLWLMENPDSKYNDSGFIFGIKGIERMADMGVDRETRVRAFQKLCKDTGITEGEAAHFIAPEFLK